MAESVLYSTQIKPLFRESDRDSMSFAFDLWSYDDVREHADDILERLTEGTMPCDGGWAADKLELFKRWVDGGKQP